MKYRLIILLVLSMQILFGQETTLNETYKEGVIEHLSKLLSDFYIYPAVAEKVSKDLYKQLESGYFDEYGDDESFAKALTEVVQSVSKDKHMRIMYQSHYEVGENTIERKAELRMDQINNYRNYNHGFRELKLLEGNVAYLDLRSFSPIDRAKEIADAYMKLLSQADAIIIDLSKNGGGDPSMVQYLCSYFFEDIIHLNSLYYREGDRTEEYWTLEQVGGKKMTDVPLYIMISEETFSGAEEFSYNMQTQKRATIIGQKSKGGANPGGMRGINENLAVFIPTGRAINPITKTSWEGVGVMPEVVTKKEETFNKALTLAKNEAAFQRNSKLEQYIHLHKELDKHLDEYKNGESEANIQLCISNFVDSGLFGEWDINTLGYDYLMKLNKPKIALCILRSNTMLYPESPNVFDSYGEALKINGNLKASIDSYQKAVDLAMKTNDRNLAYYEEALDKIQNEIEKDE